MVERSHTEDKEYGWDDVIVSGTPSALIFCGVRNDDVSKRIIVVGRFLPVPLEARVSLSRISMPMDTCDYVLMLAFIEKSIRK